MCRSFMGTWYDALWNKLQTLEISDTEATTVKAMMATHETHPKFGIPTAIGN